MKLTISIPTYNRPEQLLRTLKSLLPQLNHDCFLRILDNHSRVPVAEYAEDLISNYKNVKYEIITNRFNIGADANVIRCFELCETQWLWTLSDDDEIVDNSVALIFSEIEKWPDAVNINFYSPHNLHPIRKETIVSYGRLNFIKNADNFGASIFISTNIYNTTKLKTQWKANANTYSRVTQWLVVYYSLTENSQTVLSDKILCYNTFVSDKFSNTNISIALGFSTLLDLPTNRVEKKQIIRLLRTSTGWITLESILKCLLIDYIKSNNTLDIKFLFKRIYNNAFKLYGFKFFLKYQLYWTMIAISPAYTFRVLRMVILKKRGIDINSYL